METKIPWIIQFVSDYRHIIFPALIVLGLYGLISLCMDMFEGLKKELKE